MDCNYVFWADALNKFSQFTPWVQVVLVCGVVAGTTACFMVLCYAVIEIAVGRRERRFAYEVRDWLKCKKPAEN